MTFFFLEQSSRKLPWDLDSQVSGVCVKKHSMSGESYGRAGLGETDVDEREEERHSATEWWFLDSPLRVKASGLGSHLAV